ncbi:MAG: flagellar FlbD family protein [Erysipelotrichales bacterium]|nr:flagellar FlbD family protein [Erysipelotrichales bacterium]
MITLTKLDGTVFVLNCDLIEEIFANPDTTIRLVNDRIVIVKDTVAEIVQKTIDYRKQVFQLILTEPLRVVDKKED